MVGTGLGFGAGTGAGLGAGIGTIGGTATGFGFPASASAAAASSDAADAGYPSRLKAAASARMTTGSPVARARAILSPILAGTPPGTTGGEGVGA